MDEFERLLLCHKGAIERYVKFRVSSEFDADDILQETYIAACRSFETLVDRSVFKPWLIGIARNKIGDYYRQKARRWEIPLQDVVECIAGRGRYGISERECVRETISALADKDKQILYAYYFCRMSQSDISEKLGIPIGTVKSRLHTAKQNFKEHYPYPPKQKGEKQMKQLPEYMPAYSICESTKPPFAVKWEELMGWFLVPKLGEKLSWAMYDMPSRRMGECDHMEVVGKAEVHGIEGVEITVKTLSPMACNSEGGQQRVDRTFVAQLTDTHCRYLAESHVRGGVKKIYTFLDGDDFLDNWGFGENNCGNETNLRPKGDIRRTGKVVSSVGKEFLLDIVGRYTVTIGGKSYDTVCVMDIETYNCGVATEHFLDQNGRTILWRRFNRDTWALDHYQKLWSEQLPENDRLTINGTTYVHWYDCITDYILS